MYRVLYEETVSPPPTSEPYTPNVYLVLYEETVSPPPPTSEPYTPSVYRVLYEETVSHHHHRRLEPYEPRVRVCVALIKPAPLESRANTHG